MGMRSEWIADSELDVDLSAARDEDATAGWRIVVAVDALADNLEVGPARWPEEQHGAPATYRCGKWREASPEGIR
jgi:hypothetical protein